MQRLEVSGVVRQIWWSLGVKGLRTRTKRNKLLPQSLSSELKVEGFDVKTKRDYVLALWSREDKGRAPKVP